MLYNFFESVAWPMETPDAYGTFHILFTLIGFSVCAFSSWKLRNVSDKTARHILFACGLGNVSVFLLHRDGTLYSAFHLISGIVLAIVGIWLVAKPLLVAALIPRVIGILLLIHGINDLTKALALRKKNARNWKIALLLAAVTTLFGVILVVYAVDIFTTGLRIIGLFLVYDGVSDIWILAQIYQSNKLPPAAAASDDTFPAVDTDTAVDVSFKDLE